MIFSLFPVLDIPHQLTSLSLVMKFNSKLESGILLKRYKRFLGDIKLPDGQVRTIHCANTGAMTGCATPGDTIWFSTSDNPKRKYPNSWELTHTQAGHYICVNTIQANRLAKEAIKLDLIKELSGYQELKTEVKYGDENSRIDLLLTDPDKADCYIEVKSVTLLSENGGLFPDAVTTRGQKHLRELIKIKQQGKRAVLLFAVLHSGISRVSPAKAVDPVYSDIIKQALGFGVEVLAYKAKFSLDEMQLVEAIPFSEDQVII